MCPAHACRFRILISPQQTHQMRHGGEQNKHMEHLMRAPPHIKAARWCKPFRHTRLEYSRQNQFRKLKRSLNATYGVDPCPKHVQTSLEDEPGKTDPVVHGLQAVAPHAVQHGNNGREAHGDEHAGAKGAPFGRAELREDGDEGAAEGEDRDLLLAVSWRQRIYMITLPIRGPFAQKDCDCIPKR